MQSRAAKSLFSEMMREQIWDCKTRKSIELFNAQAPAGGDDKVLSDENTIEVRDAHSQDR